MRKNLNLENVAARHTLAPHDLITETIHGMSSHETTRSMLKQSETQLPRLLLGDYRPQAP